MDFNASISTLQARLKTITGKAKNGGSSVVSLKLNMAGSHTSKVTKPLFKIIGKYHYEHEDILGLEISPHYIRVCQMKNSYGRWSLNQLASSCMENQFTNIDIQQNQDLYVENLKTLLDKHNIKTKDVVLSVPTSASIIKIINMPDMDEGDLAEAASLGAIWESMVQLSGSIHEYSVYYKILNHKVKPSMSLAIKDAISAQSTSLDSLLGNNNNEIPAFAGPEVKTDVNLFTGPEIKQEVNLFTGPEITAPDAPATESANETHDQVGTGAAEEQSVSSAMSTPESETPEEILPDATLVEALPEEEANTMDVLFVATKMTDAMLYMDIAQKAGLEPVIIDAKCNALKHAFETNPDKHKIPQPYALLEFGADENYIYIIEDLKVAAFNINISDAERQLMTRGVDNIETVQGFIENYAQQLHDILNNYAAQNKSGNKVCNIYVSSNAPLHVEDASSEPLINSFIKQISQLLGGYQISPCNFCNHIEVPAAFAKKVNAEGNLSSWATVLGLATYKLDVFGYDNEAMPIDKVNLLPGSMAQIKTRATQVISTLAMAASLAFVMIISAASFVMLSATGSSLAGEIKTLEYVHGEYDGKNTELQKLSMVMEKVKSLDKVRTTLPSNQMQILTVYKNMASAIPEGVWLSDINFTPAKGIEIKGNSINDQNILEFVKKLNESGALKKVSLKTMEAIEKNDKASQASGLAASPVKKFTLQGDLGSDAGTEKLELLSGGVK